MLLLQQSLTEVTQKVVASLQTRIDEHAHSSSAGLDFLDAKNGLFLSYLIELTYHLRNHLRLLQQQQQESLPPISAELALVQQQRQRQSLHRLRVLKTGLDKLRGLDKKLRYQIDKLLAAHADGANPSAQFATATKREEEEEEDPLHFRPGRMAPEDDDDDHDENSTSSSNSNRSEDEEGKAPKDQAENEAEQNEASDVDDDLAAAQRTISMARAVKRKTSRCHDTNDNDAPSDTNHDTIYRAPRLAAVPYAHDDPRATRERRQRRQWRASEVAQTLRHHYGPAPEQDDSQGGGGVGRQRDATRRLEERERERTAFEEDNMIRLAVPRVEKKERKRWMREEMSNLGAIADLGNLARDSGLHRQHKKSSSLGGGVDGNNSFGGHEDERYVNGKRRKQVTDREGRAAGKSEHRPKAQNALQEAMFGASSSGKNKKRKSKR